MIGQAIAFGDITSSYPSKAGVLNLQLSGSNLSLLLSAVSRVTLL
jgi:hypothetical protein